MQFFIAEAPSVRPGFNAFSYIERHPSNILNSANFTPPPKKSWLDKLVDFLRQEGQP